MVLWWFPSVVLAVGAVVVARRLRQLGTEVEALDRSVAALDDVHEATLHLRMRTGALRRRAAIFERPGQEPC